MDGPHTHELMNLHSPTDAAGQLATNYLLYFSISANSDATSAAGPDTST